MQLSLALDAKSSPVAAVHARLSGAFGSFLDGPRPLPPVDQLVRSMIGSLTYDEVSWGAYHRLRDLYRPWETLAAAPAAEVERAIGQVTHAQTKAGWLPEALQRIVALRGALDLDFLADLSVPDAMAWLQQLPGVGDKVAACVLNFSSLRRPVMVVDTHVWRAARRIGLAGRNAEPAAVREAIMAAAPHQWTADDYFDLHWLLKRLGQVLCQPAHTRCGRCPAAALCQERQRTQAMAARKGEVAAPLAFLAARNKP
jgi:endonuclease-3